MRRAPLLLLVAACFSLLVSGQSIRAAATLIRASTSSAGVEGDDESSFADISADGSRVVFFSWATTLVADDTNGVEDIFLFDRTTGVVSLVSAPPGGLANGPAGPPAISADGRFVVFASIATNLVAGDTNNAADVFVRELSTGGVSRVSVGLGGAQANGRSIEPAISADGRTVVFASIASNLVAGDTNNTQDIFLHDRQTGTTTRVSVSTAGAQGESPSSAPDISSDGKLIVYRSGASNLVGNDTNGVEDIFLRDQNAGTTARVSLTQSGGQSNGGSGEPTISGDGRLVAFTSVATNLVSGDTNGVSDAFVRDRQAATTTRHSLTGTNQQGTAAANNPVLSSDGRILAFDTGAALLPDDTNGKIDIYLKDLQDGALSRVMGDEQPDDDTSLPALSADGSRVAFPSLATNLVSDDDNNMGDVFVLERAKPPEQITYLSAKASGTVAGQAYATNDLLRHSSAAPAWRNALDMSAVNRAITQNLNAFTILPDGSLLMTFLSTQAIAGAGTFSAFDIVRFVPSVPDDWSAGTFQPYLTGKSAGLTTSGEKIDALAWTPDGLLAVSTVGVASVPCAAGTTACLAGVLKAQDEDLIAYQPSTGTWTLVFDGSTLTGMAVEDVAGASYDPSSGVLYLSLLDTFKVAGISGNARNILSVTGSGAAATVRLDWSGTAAGFSGTLDAIEVRR